MSEEFEVFEFIPCPESWREGFLIPVRSRLNNLLENEFLPSEYRDKYVEVWGETIIYDDQFVDWYCKLKKEE